MLLALLWICIVFILILHILIFRTFILCFAYLFTLLILSIYFNLTTTLSVRLFLFFNVSFLWLANGWNTLNILYFLLFRNLLVIAVYCFPNKYSIASKCWAGLILVYHHPIIICRNLVIHVWVHRHHVILWVQRSSQLCLGCVVVIFIIVITYSVLVSIATWIISTLSLSFTLAYP